MFGGLAVLGTADLFEVRLYVIRLYGSYRVAAERQPRSAYSVRATSL